MISQPYTDKVNSDHIDSDVDEDDLPLSELLKRGKESTKSTTSLPVESIFMDDMDNATSNAPLTIHLPKHFRCASHTLNLLGKTDVNKALSSCTNSLFICTYRRGIGKVKAFWVKIARSHTIAEDCEKILGNITNITNS